MREPVFYHMRCPEKYFNSSSDRLFVCVPFMATGMLVTQFLEETNQMTLEEMAHERQEQFISGELLHVCADHNV